MKPASRAEDLLAVLLRIADILARPSPYNILRGFEAWDYENSLRPHLKQLERARLLERHGSGRGRTFRVTERGRLAALGGVNPVQRWERDWDGRWRLFLFDLPSRNRALRVRLWRWLRNSRYGYLQNSVWISPDPISDETLPLRLLKLTPESFLVIEGRPAGLSTDPQAAIVNGAWDFALINRRYQKVLDLAGRGMELAGGDAPKPSAFREWLSQDREAWVSALAEDPLLPEVLLPSGYLGRKAWKQRQVAIEAITRRGFVAQKV